MLPRTIEQARAKDVGAPVCGVDEAGRGPLAGPVVAAAVILPPGFDAPGLNDSKKLSAARRETFATLVHQTAAVSLGIAGPEEIDDHNILHATMLAMRRAVAGLGTRTGFALIDGNRIPENLPCPAEALVKGDGREACIAAAGIIAKTHRDKIMCDLDRRYPGYGFAAHAGYPTKAHVTALQSLGPCPAHRQSFRPVRDMFASTTPHNPMTP